MILVNVKGINFKLLEISANDLAASASSVKQGSFYKVTAKDLSKVDNILQSFTDHTELIAHSAAL